MLERLGRRLMALLRTTAEVDRREARTRAVVAAAEEDISTTREVLGSVRRLHRADLERWRRLYSERVNDRVGPVVP